MMSLLLSDPMSRALPAPAFIIINQTSLQQDAALRLTQRSEGKRDFFRLFLPAFRNHKCLCFIPAGFKNPSDAGNP